MNTSAMARTGQVEARRAARGSLTEGAARAGLTARGVIYLLVGVLALRIAFGHGEHASVEVETHDVGHDLRGGDVRGRVHRGQVVGELGDALGHPQQRADGIRRIQQPTHHHGPLRDHEATSPGPVGSAVGGGQITEVVETWVGRVVDVDQQGHARECRTPPSHRVSVLRTLGSPGVRTELRMQCVNTE